MSASLFSRILILENSCNYLQIQILQMQVYFPLGALQ